MNPHQHTTTIQADPNKLWALCANPALWSRWDPEVQEATLEGSMRIGATGQLTTVKGQRFPFRVLVCDPSQTLLLSHPLSVGVDLLLKLHWEGNPAGIQLTGEIQLVGPMAALKYRMSKVQLLQRLEQRVHGLRRELESYR
ncbi:SRPBCC family protein [Deinococcus roseus]|uniref:Polyketide cyclase n=1 Tax=Deinococcus roseus TaxID=392414 RepID=A0ABQ2DH04_9DEIO|nr:SRPBCC family protein [Deinococcus roseus]GGJ57700.1 hypothetical protein GCM10008938_49730 [Deinococcus roseus]